MNKFARKIRTMMKMKARAGRTMQTTRSSHVRERKDRKISNQRRSRPNLSRNGAKMRRTCKFGKRTGINITVAAINIKGVGDSCKRMTVEEWAMKHSIDVLCVAETQHPYSSTEQAEAGLYVEEEKVRGDWKWYFSFDVDPKHLEINEN